MKNILFIILISILLVACGDSSDNPTTAETLTERHYLALMKSQEDHKLDMEQIFELVQGVLPTTMAVAVSDRSISSLSINATQLPINHELRFQGGKGSLAFDDDILDEPVEIYSLDIGGESFVLVTNDMRVGPILAIAEGSLEEAPPAFLEILMSGIENYIDAIIAMYNDITEEEIEEALQLAIEEGLIEYIKDEYDEDTIGALQTGSGGISTGPGSANTPLGSNFKIERVPLLQTNWGQGEWSNDYAYNAYIKHHYSNNNFLAGCGPVAIAQIVAYHNHINVSPLQNILGNHRPHPFNTSTLGRWTGTYNLSLIRGLEEIDSSSSIDARGQVAALMFQIGKLANARYSARETWIYESGAISAFQALGYSIQYLHHGTSVSGSSSNFTINYFTPPAIIRNNLDNNRPILMRGATANGESAHFWVIDGYGSMSYTVLGVGRNAFRQVAVTRIRYDNIVMVHSNMGWNGRLNGWYIYGIFNTANISFDSRHGLDIKGGDGNFSAGTRVLIPVPRR